MKKKHYTCALKPSFDELPKLKIFINKIGDVYDLKTYDKLSIKLALEELIVNIISYGFVKKHSKKNIINLKVFLDNGQLNLYLTDTGRPFNPLKYKPQSIDTPIDKRKPGDLGILLVKKFMDSLFYTRRKEENQLRIIKKI